MLGVFCRDLNTLRITALLCSHLRRSGGKNSLQSRVGMAQHNMYNMRNCSNDVRRVDDDAFSLIAHAHTHTHIPITHPNTGAQ